jgi:hypothetical protein
MYLLVKPSYEQTKLVGLFNWLRATINILFERNFAEKRKKDMMLQSDSFKRKKDENQLFEPLQLSIG